MCCFLLLRKKKSLWRRDRCFTSDLSVPCYVILVQKRKLPAPDHSEWTHAGRKENLFQAVAGGEGKVQGAEPAKPGTAGRSSSPAPLQRREPAGPEGGPPVGGRGSLSSRSRSIALGYVSCSLPLFISSAMLTLIWNGRCLFEFWNKIPTPVLIFPLPETAEMVVAFFSSPYKSYQPMS